MGRYGINISANEMASILSLMGIDTRVVYGYSEFISGRKEWAYWVNFPSEKEFIAIALPVKPERDTFIWGKQEFDVERVIQIILHDVCCGCSSCCFNLLEAICDNGGDVNGPTARKLQDYYDWKTSRHR